MLLRIIYDALDLNSHFKLFQLVSRRGFGLHRRPHRNIDHSLRDRFRNFGLPACEGVAGAGRGAVERGGRGILPKVRIDLIGENFFVLNAVGVGDGVYLRHRYAALLLDLPAVPGPDQRDRNDLLIVLDMFQVLERRVERGHIAFGVIVDVAKPVVPVLPRLADEVVFIVNAEQTVGFRMLLRIIYDALDLNSHFKLFQIVSRRGFGLADDFNDRYFTLLLPFPVPVNSYFGVIAEGDGQRCVLLVNEPVLGAGEVVICRQIRRYRDRRGDVVALLVRLHIADRILRRGGNIIRLVSMCCFVVLADDSKAAVQRRGLRGLHRRLGAVNRDIGKRFRVAFSGNFPVVSPIDKRNRNGRGVFRSACMGRRCVIPVVCRYIWCYREIHRAEPVLVNRICAARVKRTHEVGEVFGAVICRHCAVDLCNVQAKQIVLRGRVRFVYGRGLLAVLNLDHTQAVVQYPLAILIADYKPQRCLVRIVELMRLRFFAVVLCDIRRGLDGHVVFPRLIQSRRFRPVERLALRVVDQVVVFRPAAGGADVLYLNLPDSGFQIVIGGNRNKRGLRSALFPDGVDGLGRIVLGQCDRLSARVLRSRSIRLVRPANVLIATAVLQLRCINMKREGSRRCGPIRYFREPSTVRAVVILIIQIVHVGWVRVGVLRDQIDRRALVAGRRVFQVEAPSLRVRICFLAPANDLIAAVHSCSVRSCLDIADGDRVVVVGRVAVIRRVLAYKLRVFRCTVIVADTELIADIKNGESYIDLMAGIQCLRTDTVVSC